MDILQISVIGIAGMLLAITLRQQRPEIAQIITLAAGIAIILPAMHILGGVFESVMSISERYNINIGYVSTVIKIIAIAYICQFSSDMCRDAGQGALASKIEFCARILILVYALPIATALLELIVSILP